MSNKICINCHCLIPNASLICYNCGQLQLNFYKRYEMEFEKKYKDYSLNEKIIYAKGWNEAIRAAAKICQHHGVIITVQEAIEKLDRSIQACDD